MQSGTMRQEEVRRRFGARVRALRKARGLSQEKVALRCGLDRSYVGGIDPSTRISAALDAAQDERKGENNVSLVNIHRVAEALGVEAGELFG